MRSEPASASRVAALSFESPSVSVWKRGGHVVLAIMALTVALFTAEVPVLPVLVAGLALELWRRVHAARSARPRPARVEVSDFLAIERGVHRFYTRKSEITDCWQLPHQDSAHVKVFAATPQALISIEVADRATADALSRALGVDTASNLVSATLSAKPALTDPSRPLKMPPASPSWALLLGWLVVAFLVLMSPARQEVLPLLPIIVAVVMLIPAVRSVFRVSAGSRIFVGRDGLLLTLDDRRQFIGFERVKSVRDGLHAIRIKLASGDEIVLPLSVRMRGFNLWKPHPLDRWLHDVDHVLARRGALARQINDALQRFREAGTDSRTETAARLLDRGPRSFREWREALSHAHADTYRERQLDLDQLVTVLESPSIPLGQRLGAALALAERRGSAGGGAHEARLRAVVASSASSRVRIALERATDGKLDENEYARALEDEAEAERLAHKSRRAKGLAP